MNTLKINGTTLNHRHIKGGTLSATHSMIGETLSADAITVDVSTGRGYAGAALEAFIPKGETETLRGANNDTFWAKGEFTFDTEDVVDILAFNVGDAVEYRVDGLLVGVYYITAITRKSRDIYSITARSMIANLTDKYHYGGIYTEAKAGTLYASVLSGIPYTISSELSNATVTGYLPIASKRENLQQLLFATGGAVYVESSGRLRLEAMRTGGKTGLFEAKRCYVGGTVEESAAITRAQVTEHNYIPVTADEPDVLYEDGVSGSTVIHFDEPHHTLVCTGGTITSSGANFATISASGLVKLTGHPYAHITRPVYAGSEGDENITKSVTNATLANPQNAQALAGRVLRYAQCNRVIRQGVTMGKERVGDAVYVMNPYTNEYEKAVITAMDVVMSGINRANCSFLVGYTPEGIVSGYKSYAVLTGSGSWTVPAGSSGTIRVIVVSAGDGGGGGAPGRDGETFADGENDYSSRATTNAETMAGGVGGAGGAGGAGGTGGKVYEITLNVASGQSFAYSCGVGGSGGNKGNGESAPAPGGTGGNTTFGTVSSASGTVYPSGYYEPKSKLTLGKSGNNGYNGGKGGDGGKPPTSGSTTGERGGNAGTYSGGAGGAGNLADFQEPLGQGQYDTIRFAAGGGGGGGAAYGNAGAAGTAGFVPETRTGQTNGGAGGNGGTGTNGASGNSYGCGGNGGNGGGGGGGGGAALRRSFGNASKGVAVAGLPGTGGGAGNGGKGGNGVIIIYY